MAKRTKLSVKQILEKYKGRYDMQQKIEQITIVNNAQKPLKQKKLINRKNRQWLII
jgi:hypothetical protein